MYFHIKTKKNPLHSLKNVISHGEKNLGISAREFMVLTHGLFIRPISQASLDLFPKIS